MKLTPIRKEILRIVKDSDKPINTKLIKEKFQLEADISNIYRNLNVLELDRSINSISIEGIKYYYAFESQNGHFIICKSCGEIQTFYNCHEHKLKEELEKEFGYRLLTHNLYFEGYCGLCDSVRKKKKNNLGGLK